MAFLVLKKRKTDPVMPDGLSAETPVGWSNIANSDGSISVPLSYDPEVLTYYVAVDLTAGTEYTFSSDYNPNLQLYLNGSKVAGTESVYNEETDSNYYPPLTFTPSETGQYILYCGGDIWGDISNYTLTASPAVSGSTFVPASWFTATELDAVNRPLRHVCASDGKLYEPLPFFDMPLAGDVSATLNGVAVTPGVYGTLNFAEGTKVPEGTQVALFDGSQYIDVPLDVEFFQGNASIRTQVYQENNRRFGYFAGTRDGYLGVDNNGLATYNIWAGNSGWNIIQSDGTQGRGEVPVWYCGWVDIIYVHDADNSEYRLYIAVRNALADYAVPQLSKTIESTAVIGSGANLRFGAWGNSSYRFSGQMRCCQAYDIALTEELIEHVIN